MLPYNRPEPPLEWEAGHKQWTLRWLDRRAENPGATFGWPTVKGSRVNRIVAPILLDATQQHCAYCDGFPLFNNDETVDHFKPKSAFPEDAYNWSNLFPACSHCQTSKMENFDDLLIKPDIPGYTFNDYFFIDFTTFLLFSNPSSSEEKQQMANISIAIFGLNHKAHIASRRHHFDRSILARDTNRVDFAYRYLF